MYDDVGGGIFAAALLEKRECSITGTALSSPGRLIGSGGTALENNPLPVLALAIGTGNLLGALSVRIHRCLFSLSSSSLSSASALSSLRR